MVYSVITFYKYDVIDNPKDFRDNIRLLCEELNIFGRILISEEGINAGVSGKKKDIDRFKLEICNLFENLKFKIENFTKTESSVVSSYPKATSCDEIEVPHLGQYGATLWPS